jgi:hypothetical protein
MNRRYGYTSDKVLMIGVLQQGRYEIGFTTQIRDAPG